MRKPDCVTCEQQMCRPACISMIFVHWRVKHLNLLRPKSQYSGPEFFVCIFEIMLNRLSCQTQLTMKSNMLIIVKPTVVGILTFISRINATFEKFKQKPSIFHYFTFYGHLNIHVNVEVEYEKRFIIVVLDSIFILPLPTLA